MLMLVTEQTIAKACRLVVGGERWWKKEHVVTEFVNQFLLPDKKNLNWRRGVPRSWIRPEWHTALIVIHRYITCEGRFSLVYIYHIRILMHLNGDYPLNLPYFLLKSLTKMSKRVQSLSTNAKSSLFHQVLIKTLVMSSLRELQKPWSWLMQSLNPNTQSNKQKKGKGKKIVTQKQNISIDETPVKEEMDDIRVTRTNRGKRPKWETKNEILPEADLKTEEDHSEDAKADIKRKTRMSPVHKESLKEGKKIVIFSTGPVTRETTRSSKAEAVFSDDKGYYFAEPEKLQEILCFFTCYSLYLQERLQNSWRGIC
jgi:hypothetical protein